MEDKIKVLAEKLTGGRGGGGGGRNYSKAN